METSPLSGTPPSLYTTSSYSSTTSYDWSQASTSSSVSSSAASRSASPMPFYPSPLHPPPNNNSGLRPPPNDHHHLSRTWSDGSSLSVPPNHGYAHQHRPFHSASMPLGVPFPVPLHPPPSYSSSSSSSSEEEEEEMNTTSYSPPQVEPTAAAPTAESSTEVQASPETLQIVDLPDVDSPTTAIALLFELPAETPILTTSVSSESTTASMPAASAPSTPRTSMVVLPTTDEPSVAVQHPEEFGAPVLAGKEEIADNTLAMEEIATVEPSVDVPLVLSPTTVAYLPAIPIESNPDMSLGLEMAPLALSSPVTPLAVSPPTTVPSSCLSLIVEPLFDQPSSSASSSSPSTEDMSLPTSIPLPDSPIEELGDQTLSVPTANEDHLVAALVVKDVPMGTTAPSSPSQTPRSSTVVLPLIEPTPELSIEDLFTAVLPTEESLTTLSPVAESTSAPTLTISDATLSSSVAASGTATVPVPPPTLPPLCFTPVFAPPTVPPPPPPTTAPPSTLSQLIQPPLDAPPMASSTLKFTPPVLPPPLILPQWTVSPMATTTSTSVPSLDSTVARYLANSQTMAPSASASVVDSPAETMVTPSFGPSSFAPPPVAPYTPATFKTASYTVEPLVISPLTIVPPPTTPSVASSTIVSPLIIAPPVTSPPVVMPPVIPPPSSLSASPTILSPPTFAPPSIAPPIAAATAAPVATPFYAPPLAPPPPPPSLSSSFSSFSVAAAPTPIMETAVIAPLAVVAIVHPTAVELSTPSSPTLVEEERRPTFGFGPPMTAPPSASNVLTRSNSLVSLQSQSAVTPTDVSPIVFSPPPPPPAGLHPWMAPLSSPLPPPTIPPPSKALPAIPSPSPSPSPLAEPPIIPPPSKALRAIISPPMFAPPSVAPPVVAALPLYNPPTAPPPSSFFSVAATPSVPLTPPPDYTLEYNSGYPSGGNYPGAPSNGAHP
ncbi:hypothetical protein FRC19_003912 [Serendipita sp. 401]|nr:hypothetical protein FRC19_003912 [Serendipita sp. 401]KAG9058553.1 hypothetical protein FS842_007975 [Serendipita sp. 407]